MCKHWDLCHWAEAAHEGREEDTGDTPLPLATQIKGALLEVIVVYGAHQAVCYIVQPGISAMKDSFEELQTFCLTTKYIFFRFHLPGSVKTHLNSYSIFKFPS